METRISTVLVGWVAIVAYLMLCGLLTGME